MAYTLQELSDKQEIQELIYDYAEAIDQQDFDRLDGLFTSDAFIDYTAMGGISGDFAEIKDFLKKALPSFSNYYHLNANMRIHLDGDNASGRVMCFNPMTISIAEDKSQTMFLGLFYLDEYRRTETGWRFSRRVEESSWNHNLPDFMSLG
ncbi:MAG: nuclear transport factor 2 family protein [Pseudomonadales bacterium]